MHYSDQSCEQCNRSTHSYSVKVVNRLGRGGYEYVSLESHAIYLEVADLKKDILAGCEKYLEPGKDLQFGHVAMVKGASRLLLYWTVIYEICTRGVKRR